MNTGSKMKLKPSPKKDDGEADKASNSCRVAGNFAIGVFLKLLREAASDGVVKMEDAERVARTVMDAKGPLETFYRQTFAEWTAAYEETKIQGQRTNVFGRLVVETFVHLFDDPRSEITRELLPRFFTALYMLLGDQDLAECREICMVVATEKRAELGDTPIWEAYFADRRCIAVLDRILVIIARRFKRFEIRKNWFLTIMNTDQENVSLAGNVFVPKEKNSTAEKVFADRNFYLLFTSLFDSVRLRNLEEARKADFKERFGETPKKIFGAFFIELEKLHSMH